MTASSTTGGGVPALDPAGVAPVDGGFCLDARLAAAADLYACSKSIAACLLSAEKRSDPDLNPPPGIGCAAACDYSHPEHTATLRWTRKKTWCSLVPGELEDEDDRLEDPQIAEGK